MRYKLFSKFDQTRVDATGLYTMVLEAHALDMARRVNGSRTLDICSGIGAMSVALARSGQQVTAVEIDASRVDMARHNARGYGVADRIDFRVADITSAATLESLPAETDTLFLDPPWGDGPGEYQRRSVTYLEHLQLADTLGRTTSPAPSIAGGPFQSTVCRFSLKTGIDLRARDLSAPSM